MLLLETTDDTRVNSKGNFFVRFTAHVLWLQRHLLGWLCISVKSFGLGLQDYKSRQQKSQQVDVLKVLYKNELPVRQFMQLAPVILIITFHIRF